MSIEEKGLEPAPAVNSEVGNEATDKAFKEANSSTVRSIRWQKILTDNVRLVTVALAIALVVRFFIAEPRYIPSPSMVPTLAVGDRLLVEKVSYRFEPPHRGDIIVFEPPPQLQEYGYSASQAFIKRVIGLPGETVKVTQGQVFINNESLSESYILESPVYEMPPVRVPASSLFVMGDNRNDSNDSHVWGFLPVENAIGRAAFRFWPLEKVGWVAKNPRNPI